MSDRTHKATIERGVPAAVREHFRHVIRRWREDKGLTQRALAKRFGITTGMYSHWETGFRFPTDAMLPRVAEVIGIPLEGLLGEPVRQPTQDIPVVGEIHAGKTRGPKPDAVVLAGKNVGEVEITWAMVHDFLPESESPLVALRVAGAGLEPRFRAGDVVFVEKIAELPDAGALVVVQLPGEGHAIKALIEGADGQYLASLSPSVFPIPCPKRPKLWGVVRGVMGRR